MTDPPRKAAKGSRARVVDPGRQQEIDFLRALVEQQQSQIGQLIAAKTPGFPLATVAEVVAKYMRSVRFKSLAAASVEEIRYRRHVLPALGSEQVGAGRRRRGSFRRTRSYARRWNRRTTSARRAPASRR